MFREAPDEWIKEVYVSESFLRKCEQENDKESKERIKKHHYEVFADDVFRKVSDTQTPQGVLCVLGKSGNDTARRGGCRHRRRGDDETDSRYHESKSHTGNDGIDIQGSVLCGGGYGFGDRSIDKKGSFGLCGAP